MSTASSEIKQSIEESALEAYPLHRLCIKKNYNKTLFKDLLNKSLDPVNNHLDPLVQNAYGWLPIHTAVYYYNLEAFEDLAEHAITTGKDVGFLAETATLRAGILPFVPTDISHLSPIAMAKRIYHDPIIPKIEESVRQWQNTLAAQALLPAPPNQIAQNLQPPNAQATVNVNVPLAPQIVQNVPPNTQQSTNAQPAVNIPLIPQIVQDLQPAIVQPTNVQTDNVNISLSTSIVQNVQQTIIKSNNLNMMGASVFKTTPALEEKLIKEEKELQKFPLHDACYHFAIDKFKALLQSGVDPRSEYHNGWLPIHFAAAINHLEAIAVLGEYWLETGEDVGFMAATAIVEAELVPSLVKDEYSTRPIQLAKWIGNVEAASLIHQYQIRFNTQVHEACRDYTSVRFKELLQQNRDLLYLNDDGWTALHVAVFYYKLEAIDDLCHYAIETGKDIGFLSANAIVRSGLVGHIASEMLHVTPMQLAKILHHDPAADKIQSYYIEFQNKLNGFDEEGKKFRASLSCQTFCQLPFQLDKNCEPYLFTRLNHYLTKTIHYNGAMPVPRTPVFHPYNPNDNENGYGGQPGAVLTLRCPEDALQYLPVSIINMLQDNGIPKEKIDLFVVAQSMPWNKGTAILFRPHFWVHGDFENDEAVMKGAYNNAVNCRIGIYHPTTAEIKLDNNNAGTLIVNPMNVNSHAEQAQGTLFPMTISSPANGVMNGIDVERTDSLYSVVYAPNGRMAITLHWLLSPEDLEILTFISQQVENLNGFVQMVARFKESKMNIPDGPLNQLCSLMNVKLTLDNDPSLELAIRLFIAEMNSKKIAEQVERARFLMLDHDKNVPLATTQFLLSQGQANQQFIKDRKEHLAQLMEQINAHLQKLLKEDFEKLTATVISLQSANIACKVISENINISIMRVIACSDDIKQALGELVAMNDRQKLDALPNQIKQWGRELDELRVIAINSEKDIDVLLKSNVPSGNGGPPIFS